jgi:hypothetical protein
MPSKRAAEKPRSGIFISYRRSDTADAVGRVHDRLEAQFGHGIVFRDVDDIQLGADFRERLNDALDRSAVVLVAIGPRWLTETDETGRRRIDDPGDVLRIEVETALERDVVVIPLLMRGATTPRRADLPESLQPLVDRNGLAIRPDPDFSSDLRRLVAAVSPHLGLPKEPAMNDSPHAVGRVGVAMSKMTRAAWAFAGLIAAIGLAVAGVWLFARNDNSAPSTSTSFIVSADPPLEEAVDPVGADLPFARSFASNSEDADVASESEAIIIYCEGFDAGSYQGLMAYGYGGAVTPECNDIGPPNNIGLLSNGDAWCSGFIDGVRGAHLQLKEEHLDTSTSGRIYETCRIRRWWTEVDPST